MIRLLATFLTPILLAAEGPTPGKSGGAPSTAPADTFLSGSELILFGKEVPPIVHDEQSGYRVTKDDSTVSINGIVFFNTKAPLPKRIHPIDPEIVRKASVLESAIKVVDSSRNEDTGEFTIDGKTHALGETFLMTVPEHQAVVSVRVEKDGFGVEYEGERIYCVRQKVVNTPVNPVDVTFQYVIRQLRGRRLVIMGAGYSYTFPISQAPDVRASLAKVATGAEVLSVDEFGRKQYKALTIDGHSWDSGVIRDIVEK